MFKELDKLILRKIRDNEYFEKGDEVNFTYYPKNKVLVYKINTEHIKKIKRVGPFRDGHQLGVCLILQGHDSEVEILRR